MEFKDRLSRFMRDVPAVVLAARLCEMGFSTTADAVNKWIVGSREPRSEAILYIARALGCTPNDLLGFEETT